MVCETWLQARLSEGYGFVTDERENITRVSRTDRLNLTITPQILAAGLAIRGRAVFFFPGRSPKLGCALYLKPVKSVFFNTLGACDVILTPYMGHA